MLTGAPAACRARAGPAGCAGTSRGPHRTPEAPGPRPGARPLPARGAAVARTFHAVRRHPRKETRSPAHAAGSASASLPHRPSRRHLWLRRSRPRRVRCRSAGPARLPRERAPGSPRGPEAVPTSCRPAGPTSPEGLPREVSPARAPSSASRTPRARLSAGLRVSPPFPARVARARRPRLNARARSAGLPAWQKPAVRRAGQWSPAAPPRRRPADRDPAPGPRAPRSPRAPASPLPRLPFRASRPLCRAPASLLPAGPEAPRPLLS